jgi:hypothetical protein
MARRRKRGLAMGITGMILDLVRRSNDQSLRVNHCLHNDALFDISYKRSYRSKLSAKPAAHIPEVKEAKHPNNFVTTMPANSVWKGSHPKKRNVQDQYVVNGADEEAYGFQVEEQKRAGRLMSAI